MHEHWKEAKERYEAIEIPEDLSFATESAVRRAIAGICAAGPSEGMGRRSGRLRLLRLLVNGQPCLCQRRPFSDYTSYL